MKRFIFAAALALAAAMPAHAADISYNHVQVGYLNVDNWSHGIAGEVSIELGQTGAYATLGGSRQTYRDSYYEDGYNIGQFGLGYAFTLREGTDLTAEVGYERLSVEYYDPYFDVIYEESADAFRGSVGIGHAVGDRFIVSGRVNHYFGGDLEEADTTFSLGAEAFITPQWSAVAEVEVGQDSSEVYLVGAQYNF